MIKEFWKSQTNMLEVKTNNDAENSKMWVVAGFLLALITTFVSFIDITEYLSTQFTFIKSHQKIVIVTGLLLIGFVCVRLVWLFIPKKLKSFQRKIVFSVALVIITIVGLLYNSNKVFTYQSTNKINSSLKSVQEPQIKIDETEEDKYTTPAEIKKELTDTKKEKFNPTINDKMSNNIFIVKELRINQKYSSDIKRNLTNDIKADISNQIETLSEANYDELNTNRSFTDEINRAKNWGAF